MTTIWLILGVASIVILLKYFRTRNAVWGGLTAGVLIGLVWSFFREEGFTIIFVAKSAIVGILVGFVFELLGNLGNRLKQ